MRNTGVWKRSNLESHHVDWDKTNNNVTNLVTLCRRCHSAQKPLSDEGLKLSLELSERLSKILGKPFAAELDDFEEPLSLPKKLTDAEIAAIADLFTLKFYYVVETKLAG